MFSPSKVVGLLVKEFGSSGDMSSPSRMERKMFESFSFLLREAMTGDVVIEEDEDVDISDDEETDPNWCPSDDIAITPSTPTGRTKVIRFNNQPIAEEKVKEALVHYRSSKKGSRTLASMTASFRFIKTERDLEKLRVYEKSSEANDTMANNQIKLAEIVYEAVKEMFEKGAIIHDLDIQQLALRKNNELSLISGFKASRTWLSTFKKFAHLRSRRITTFISKKNQLDRALIIKAASDFVDSVKQDMANLPNFSLANADQSGFLKEMHTARTLAPIGVRKVEAVVQSTSATSHSYTIMPLLYAEGMLGERLYVVLQEKGGQLPQRGCFSAPNLLVRAGHSHIMTKAHMNDWIRECVFSPTAPPSTYLLVDSWSAFKDTAAFTTAAPAGKSIVVKNIPPGATSLIQPLDLFFFCPFKAFIRRLTTHVMAHGLPFSVFQRDSILKMLSACYHQFKADAFRPMLQFPWYSAGYISSNPGPFQTPVRLCFCGDSVVNCEFPSGCQSLSFVTCAHSHCKKRLCFEHFVVNVHLC